MLQALRAGIVMMLGIVCSGCPVKDSKSSQGASADSAVMRALRLQPGDIRYQAPCRVAVETPNLPGPLSCVYVQTATHLHFLRFSGSMGEYEAVFSVPIVEVTQIALARSGADRQIQVDRAGELLVFHIAGTGRGRLRKSSAVLLRPVLRRRNRGSGLICRPPCRRESLFLCTSVVDGNWEAVAVGFP